MATMTFNTALTQLGLLINDTLLQLSSDVKTSALTAAWNSQWVVTPVWDTSLVFSANVYQYPLPSTVTTVSDVYIQRDSSQFPERISAELWEVVNGVLQFNSKAKEVIPDSFPLQLRGHYKLTTGDPLPNEVMQNYVLAEAGYNCLRNLAFTRAFSFLRNDTTMAEVIALRREMYADKTRYRQELQREFVAA